MGLLDSRYSVHRCTGVCAASGRAFAPGEPHVAVLAESPEHGLVRLDFAVDAWEGGARPGAPLRVFGFWRGVFQPHEQAKKQLMGDDELLELFDTLSGASDAKQVRFRYVLALLLIRRRLLRVVGQRRGSDGVTLQVLRRGESAGETTPTPVVDPGLDDVAIAEAVEQLTALVEGSHETAHEAPGVDVPAPAQAHPQEAR